MTRVPQKGVQGRVRKTPSVSKETRQEAGTLAGHFQVPTAGPARPGLHSEPADPSLQQARGGPEASALDPASRCGGAAIGQVQAGTQEGAPLAS